MAAFCYGAQDGKAVNVSEAKRLVDIEYDL